MKKLKILFLMITILSLLASCTPRGESSSSQTSTSSSEVSKPIQQTKVPRTEPVQDLKKENPDTIGWISIPDTHIDDVVVQGDDNDFYYRRSFEKEEDQQGVYYADYRVDLRKGLDELPTSTVIYGHAFTDHFESSQYDIKFSSLHNFRQEEFVKTHPYIYFSTDRVDYVFEVFAVFIINSNNPDIPYNNPTLKQDEFVVMVEKELLPRSIWDYQDVKINPDDKFLTLSTCIYTLEDGSKTDYPHTWYRMGVMGRMISAEDAQKETVNVIYREDALVDQDTYLKS